MTSLARQNYHEDCEANTNKQINLHLHASYSYLSMAFYFDRDDVALQGMHSFLKAQADKERENAQKLMEFQNQRGGRIVLKDVQKPAKDQWGTALEAMQSALDLEKNLNQALLELHATAGKHDDEHMADFLEGEYLKPKVVCIKKISDHVTNLKRAGPNLGEYLFDKNELQDD